MTTREEADAYLDGVFGAPTTVEAEFLRHLTGTIPDDGAAQLAAREADLAASLAGERSRLADERADIARQTERITTTNNAADLTPADWFHAHIAPHSKDHA